MEQIYYVYELCRLDGTAFYVGYGKNDRWLDHEREAGGKRQTHKTRIIMEMRRQGHRLPKRKIAEGLTKDEAAALEVALIAQYGRYPNGPLVNATDGGDGTRGWDAEQRAAMSATTSRLLQGNQYRAGIAHTTDSRAAISAGVKKAFEGKVWEPRNLTDEQKAQISARFKGVPKSEEHRAKIGAANKGKQNRLGKPHSVETLAVIRTQLTERNKSQAQRDAVRSKLVGRVPSPETKQRMREAQQARHARTRALKTGD